MREGVYYRIWDMKDDRRSLLNKTLMKEGGFFGILMTLGKSDWMF